MPFLNKTRIDVLAIVEREIESFVLTQVRGIEKCNVREEQRNGRMVRVLQTQGINLGVSQFHPTVIGVLFDTQAFYAHADFLDINTIYSNDIDFMLRNFGIEGAARTISRVFVVFLMRPSIFICIFEGNEQRFWGVWN